MNYFEKRCVFDAVWECSIWLIFMIALVALYPLVRQPIGPYACIGVIAALLYLLYRFIRTIVLAVGHWRRLQKLPYLKCQTSSGVSQRTR